MPPPKHILDSYSTSTRHYMHHQQQPSWKSPNNIHAEQRPENPINQMFVSKLNLTPTTPRYPPTNFQFLPTIPPLDREKGNITFITSIFIIKIHTFGLWVRRKTSENVKQQFEMEPKLFED